MSRQRYTSVVIGICTNNKDPEGLGRVKVKFPWLADSEESYWARVCQFMTGGGRGMWILPEVGDEVLVSFEHGDIHHPYVIGSLWNGVDRPPSDSGFNEDGKNNIRMFQSRFGHQVIFDDTAGGEKIRLMEGNAKNVVDIFNPQNSHHYTANTGEIWIKAPDGTITLECTTLETRSTKSTTWQIGKGYALNVGQNISVTSGTDTTLHTKAPTSVGVGASTNLTAGANIGVKATQVGVQGQGSARFKSGILNLATAINLSLESAKLSLDTGLFGIIKGVQHLNVTGGILSAIRGLLLNLSSGKIAMDATLAAVDLAGKSAEFKGAKVLVNKAKGKAVKGDPANTLALDPPEKVALEEFKKFADEQWKKLPEWAKNKLKTELQAKVQAEIAKIDNPYLKAALGGAVKGSGDGLGGVLAGAGQGAANTAMGELEIPGGFQENYDYFFGENGIIGGSADESDGSDSGSGAGSGSSDPGGGG